ncbi:MAG TPA: hypothetical protein VIM48_09065 [Chthoniobacterales bacterium]
MKRLPLFVGVLLALITLSTTAEAKTFPDLSAFRGHVKGTITLFSSGTNITGPASVNVIVPKSGRSATFNISGSFSFGGTTLPVSNILTFTSSRVFTAQDLLFHISTTTGASGKYSSSKRSINYNGRFNYQNTTTGTVSGAIRVHTTKTKQTIQITYFLTVDGSSISYQFSITGSRKIK